MDPNTAPMCSTNFDKSQVLAVLAASFALALPLGVLGGLDGAEGVEEVEGSEARNLGRFGERLRH